MKLGRSERGGDRAVDALVQALCVAALLAAAGTARAELSSYSGKAGIIAADETTTWCVPAIGISGGKSFGTSKFQRIALPGTVDDNYVHSQAAQRVKVQCFATQTLTGASTTITSSLSTNAGGDLAQTAGCPSNRPYAGYPRCQIESNAATPIFVYAGSNCGNGISSLDYAWISGQMTGSFYEMTTFWPFLAPFNPTVFNDTFAQGAVAGTDIGFNFVAEGKLWFGFGDTWSVEDDASNLVPPRSNVLARSSDFNPSDSNGIVFSGWETNAAQPQVARENIPAKRNDTETSAIPGAGFAFKEGNNFYRFMWFASFDWSRPPGEPPYKVNSSTLAFSSSGGVWHRAETQGGYAPPVWPGTSLFEPGSIWVDRYNRWIYFFGTPANFAGPVRLARVRPTFAALMSKNQYEYWNGSTWVKDTNGDMAEANPGHFGSSADLISASVGARIELSVAFNSYANRFTMLFFNVRNAEIELWQSVNITGPWTKVQADDQMPDGLAVPCLYSPQMSDHTLRGAGQDIWFLLSQWCVPPPGALQNDPYNVGLWGVRTHRATTANCVP